MKIQQGVYIGDRQELKDKTALVIVTKTIIKAQFDDVTTGYGYDWHEFELQEFRII